MRFQSPCRLSGSFLEGSSGPAPLTAATRTPITVSVSNGLCLPCVLGTRQELRHVLVLGSVGRPPFSGRVPAIVASRHIDTVVNQELCCFILPSDGAFVKDASRLVRASVGIDVGSTLQQERRNLKMPVHARPGQRYVQDVLRVGGSPMQVPQSGGVVGGVMLAEASPPASAAAHSRLLPSRRITAARRSCQLATPYSRASTSWASRSDTGRIGAGSWAWTWARASGSPAANWRTRLTQAHARSIRDGKITIRFGSWAVRRASVRQ